jgi:hypothetical protein
MLSNIEFTGGLVLVLALLFLLGRNIIKMSRANQQVEGLCMIPSGSCRDYALVDPLGQPYSPPGGHGIEPNDARFHTTNMVIPEQLPQTHESAKARFLTNSNFVYLDWENDQLNKKLLPPKVGGHGLLFAV